MRSKQTKPSSCEEIRNSVKYLNPDDLLNKVTYLLGHPIDKRALLKLNETWRSMMRRCFEKHNKNYENYGGRGISVCDEWKTDRAPFIIWSVKNQWSFGLTIDRIDNDGNYSPKNCRWVTNDVQQCNKRNTVIVDYHGSKQVLSKLISQSGLKGSTVRERMNRYGYTVEQALEKPLNSLVILINGIQYHRNGAIRKFTNTPKSTVLKRINHMGWSTSEAIFTQRGFIRVSLNELKRSLTKYD